MKALAITDHGNMFGAKEFHNEAKKQGIKPIWDVKYMLHAVHGMKNQISRRRRISPGICWQKTRQGYKNLIKLVSYGWTEGFYYKPRIDKEFLQEYSEGLIASSACLHGEIPWLLWHEGIECGQEGTEGISRNFW